MKNVWPLVARSHFSDHSTYTPNHRLPLVPVSIMHSSSGTPRYSDESHPARRTAPKSGTRTPRRTQWVGNNRVRVEGNPETSPRECMHELDEMGLDVCSCLPFLCFGDLRTICSPVHSKPSVVPWRSTSRESAFRASQRHRGEEQVPVHPLQYHPKPSSHSAQSRPPRHPIIIPPQVPPLRWLAFLGHTRTAIIHTTP